MRAKVRQEEAEGEEMKESVLYYLVNWNEWMKLNLNTPVHIDAITRGTFVGQSRGISRIVAS